MILENKYRKINWLLVKNPTRSNLEFLAKNFKIENEDLTATLPPLQRPRLITKQKYIFMILQFPYYNRESREIRSSEVDFFIGKSFLVMVTDGKLPPLNELFDAVHKNTKDINTNTKDDLGNLLYEILNRLLLYLFPMLNHISQDLDKVEQRLLQATPATKESITNILSIKRNIVNFRKIMQSHRDVIRRLVSSGKDFFNPERLKNYFNNLIGHTIEVWTTLENYKETINALYETHESLITYRINQIMKTLTIFAVIVFPLTLLAAIFGMNAINMPLVDLKHGFWYIIGIMLIGVILMWGYFRHKKWI